MASKSHDRRAKPVDSLAVQVFRRHCAELSRALSGSTDELASELYSANLITMQQKSQAVDVLGITPFRKADILMEAIERKILTENNAAPLRKFCRLLQKRYPVGRIIARINSCLAYVEQHHQLPGDEWSSDAASQSTKKGAIQGELAALQLQVESLQQLASVASTDADFSQAAEHILLEFRRVNKMYKPAIVDLQAFEKRLNQQNTYMYICVAGHFNTGKSTLINALLGSSILPTSGDAGAAVTVYLTIQATNDDTENVAGTPHLCSWPANAMQRPICSGVDAINQYLHMEKVRLYSRRERQEREFLVRMAIPTFSKFPNLGEGLTPYLVDLPGDYEVCQKFANVAMETATAFLYVMTYNELRNEHDFEAIKAIYSRDKNVFDDGRLIIVVTKYDISYDNWDGRNLSMEEVQGLLAGKISEALNLSKPLLKKFIIPVSGRWAFWARMYQSSEGRLYRHDVMKSLFTLSQNGIHENFEEFFTLSHEEVSSRLEEASRIVVLEERIKEMMLSMTSIRKRIIVENCEILIRTAWRNLQRKH